jgi:predicted RNA-binding Zn ribbon-like protein
LGANVSQPELMVGLADHPALEFLNSTATPVRDTVELICDGAGYLSWLESAGLIDATDCSEIAARFSTAELDAAAESAVALREWLRPVIATWAKGARRAVADSVLARLSELLAADERFFSVAKGRDGTAEIVDRRKWTQARQLLIPPAEAAAQLFAFADRTLVRQCEGPTCTLWFYDQTKSHRRRWCSMAVCGNRAKARNHRERHSARP